MDSPRKSLGNRFSEMRTVLPADSSANVSMCTNITMSPTPRESRSAEELCSACDGPSGSSNSIWMSSEASSRCDLDSCENLLVIGPSTCQAIATSSPIKSQPLIQSSQISKPLPSAMERCLSCMSKLGQGGLQLQTNGKDILSPSWTMDLGANTGTCGAPTPHSHSSGNSDRLSISSHGSSGGVTEYYYDTPRSILKGDMRRNARANTPPVPRGDSSSGQPSCMVRGCESPHRAPLRNGCTPHTNVSQGCHCHRQGSVTCGGPGPIYYCIPEQPVQSSVAGGGTETKTLINLHSHHGPYENYDFPRQTSQAVNPMSGGSSESSCCNGSCCTSNIDWGKKQAMDRNSIASSATANSDISEWYDVPKQTCGCANHAHQLAHSSINHSSLSCGSHAVSLHGQYQKSGSVACHQCPSAMPHNPLENYDVPSNCTLAVTQESQPHRSHALNGRINGEGKMPLTTSSVPHPNQIAIYAQVDKSKKKPKALPPTCDITGIGQFQNQPMYANVATDHPSATPSSIPQQLPNPTVQMSGSGYNPSNYVNLEFADSLQIYENSRDVRNHTVPAPVDVSLVHQNQRCGVSDPLKEKSVEKAIAETKDQNVVEESPSKCEENENQASGISNTTQSKNTDGDLAGLPLRRSSSVPCKGGHANRGSASSSDSGVSGDGGLFFDDSSPLNDIGSLCLHESLPRKSQRLSPGSSAGKNSTPASTPKPQSSIEVEDVEEAQVAKNDNENLVLGVENRLSPRHYETIDEVERSKVVKTVETTTVRSTLNLRNPRSLVSDANSTSSGASDMSDYIDTLSSCSRASLDIASNHHFAHSSASNANANVSMNISSSPKKSTNMKPRSGKEYFKIDRAMFARND